ncbi:unnamed protein product [Phyllotreta striolata]|uniref:Cytochrome c oxidase subunit 4 n=1 Tax=Phyllotreta striolata TaxID=444603 RepID=A0A9N9TVQ9_PHYSR|nr:unnamed protein product [Phyllotreta striolata]
MIGKREIVGYGWNGQPGYADMADFPFPSIRWKEPNCEIAELREKEKKDWREMSVCEKRELYRFSFCQTYAEFLAPTGEWKSVIGYGLMLISVGCWLFYFLKYMVQPPLPDSFRDECREAQFRRMLDIRANPIYGVS